MNGVVSGTSGSDRALTNVTPAIPAGIDALLGANDAGRSA